MGKDVIIACDFSDSTTMFSFLNKFNSRKPFVKIGMEMFYSCGADTVKKLKDEGYSVFLDLKLHDIPNTVKKSMQALRSYNVDIINVHAGGGIEMMSSAKEAFYESATKVIAVTVLTSLSQEIINKELLIDRDINEVIASYAANAKKAGLDGVVCSPLEAKLIHESIGRDFLCVTPGVRYHSDANSDQKRVATPAQAKDLTSDYIVVGRPITSSLTPKESYEQFCKDFID